MDRWGQEEGSGPHLSSPLPICPHLSTSLPLCPHLSFPFTVDRWHRGEESGQVREGWWGGGGGQKGREVDRGVMQGRGVRDTVDPASKPHLEWCTLQKRWGWHCIFHNPPQECDCSLINLCLKTHPYVVGMTAPSFSYKCFSKYTCWLVMGVTIPILFVFSSFKTMFQNTHDVWHAK